MASDPLAVLLLLGLGFTRLSVAPPALPMVKWVVRQLPLAAAQQAAAAAADATTTAAVHDVLREALGRHLDLRLVDPSGALPRPSAGTSLPRVP